MLSDSLIAVTSPPGAAGLVDVTVTTAGGTSAKSSADQFSYVAAPTVTGISPAVGPITGGTSVTITGTGFLNATAVDFGNTATSSFVVNPTGTLITVTSPVGVAGMVDVTVTTIGGTSAKSLADQFGYAPVVSALSPAQGPAIGGTPITIIGQGFTGATTVLFGSTQGTSLTVLSDRQIAVTSPPGATGLVDVTVTTAAGTSAKSSADQFSYVAAPTVTGISPAVGPITGGTSVTITGTGFLNATAVDFGNTATSSFVVNPVGTLITVTSPVGVAGLVDVTVTTIGGTSAKSLADQFGYAPVVSALSPAQGPVIGGTPMTIIGQGFIPGATTVLFGSTPPASLTVLSDRQIAVTSPPGAAGLVDVTVTTAAGTSAKSSADQFSYVAAPTVAGISPAVGPITGGTSVTITGSGFLNATAVDFGNTATSSFVVNPAGTLITVTSPVGVAGLVDVTVTTIGGTSAKSTLDQFAYAPVVSALSPAQGPAIGGTPMTIIGQGFTGATAVLFGSAQGTSLTVLSDSLIAVTSPPGAAGLVDVTVTTAGGTSAKSSADQFSYVAAPTVTGISPAVGPITGGTSVTITGTGFLNATAVDFGNTATSSFVVNPAGTLITVTSPVGVAGLVDVTVTTAGGTSAKSPADQFGYAPVVSGLSPAQGPVIGGTPMTIIGQGFIPGATTVLFGSTPPASLTVLSDRQIAVTSPPGAAGLVDVTVTTAAGTSAKSSADQFSYVAAPTVAGISPAVGPITGGTSVTITGSGFLNATAVDFGNTATSSFVVNPAGTLITVTSPAGVAGLVDVTVTTAGGTSAKSPADQFGYAAVVSAVNPGQGPTIGGTPMTITGQGFTGTTAVLFGNTPRRSFTVLSDSQIAVTSPPGAAGLVDITVITAGGTSAKSSADQFSYVAAPTVTGISPAVGPITGGTSVTISGTGFQGATAVDFGDTAASSFVVNPAGTLITVTSPAGVAGLVDVTVTTATGTSAKSSADRFGYAPVVSAVNPARGPATGGTRTTIAGAGFTGASTVLFGSTQATFTVLTDALIVVTSPAGIAGLVDVTVTTAGGTSAKSSADQFGYTPVVSAINPAQGPATGGTPMTITGAGFTGASTVLFGSTPASFTVLSDTQIAVTSPAGAAGLVDVTVTTAVGTSAKSSADQFSYVAAPKVAVISPAIGPTTGGTSAALPSSAFPTASVNLRRDAMTQTGNGNVIAGSIAAGSDVPGGSTTCPGNAAKAGSVNAQALDQIDLATVAGSETGPVAGLSDADVLAGDIVNGTLADGLRQNVSATDAAFASI